MSCRVVSSQTANLSVLDGIEALTADDELWVDFAGARAISITREMEEEPAFWYWTGLTLHDLDGDQPATPIGPYDLSPNMMGIVPYEIDQAHNDNAMITMGSGVGVLWVLDASLDVFLDSYDAMSSSDGRTIVVSVDDNEDPVFLAQRTPDTNGGFESIGAGGLAGYFIDPGPLEDPSFFAAWGPLCFNDECAELSAIDFWTAEQGWLGRYRMAEASPPAILRTTANRALFAASYLPGEGMTIEGEIPFRGLHAVRRSDGALETLMISDIWYDDVFEARTIDATRSLLLMRRSTGGQVARFDHDSGALDVLYDSESISVRNAWVDVHQKTFARILYDDSPGGEPAQLIVSPL